MSIDLEELKKPLPFKTPLRWAKGVILDFEHEWPPIIKDVHAHDSHMQSIVAAVNERAAICSELETLRQLKPQSVSDGFGSTWPPCPEHNRTMEVMRPGDARCPECEDESCIRRLMDQAEVDKNYIDRLKEQIETLRRENILLRGGPSALPLLQMFELERKKESAEQRVKELTHNIETGFMAGTYARLKNLQEIERKHETLQQITERLAGAAEHAAKLHHQDAKYTGWGGGHNDVDLQECPVATCRNAMEALAAYEKWKGEKA